MKKARVFATLGASPLTATDILLGNQVLQRLHRRRMPCGEATVRPLRREGALPAAIVLFHRVLHRPPKP